MDVCGVDCGYLKYKSYEAASYLCPHYTVKTEKYLSLFVVYSASIIN